MSTQVHFTGSHDRRPPHSGRGGARQLVLVAEDHEDTRLLLRALLEMRGLTVVEAADGEEALRLAEQQRPGLVLMDGSRPRLDGISARRQMQESPSLSGIPVVFVSGHSEPRFQALAGEAGCDACLVKPIDTAHLDRLLARHFPQQDGVGPARRLEQ